MQEVFKAGKIKREEVFVATKLWNNNHRPERVKPAFEASLRKLQLDYVDLYLIHTPFAFQPGDEQDPRDEKGNVIYDKGVTSAGYVEGAWSAWWTRASARPSDCPTSVWSSAGKLMPQGSSPAVVHVESHPYLPQWELLDYCKQSGIVFHAFAPLGHSFEPKLLDDPVIKNVASRAGMSPAQVCIAWGVQRGTAILTTSTKVNHLRESLEASFLSESAINEISAIQTRYRFNKVVETGIPGFIPRGS